SLIPKHFDGVDIFHNTLICDQARAHEQGESGVAFVGPECEPFQVDTGSRYQVGRRRLYQFTVYAQLQAVGRLKENLVGKPEADPVQQYGDGGDEVVLEKDRPQPANIVDHGNLQGGRRECSVNVRFYGKMQNNIGTYATIDEVQFQNEGGIFDGVSPS